MGIISNQLRQLNTLTKYALGTIILSVTLLQKFPLIKVPGTFVSIRAEDFILLIGGCLAFMYFAKSPKSFWKDSVYRLYVLYLAVSLASLVNAIFVINTVSPMIGLLHFLRRIEYFIPFILTYELMKRDKESVPYFFNLILIVITLVYLYGIGQKDFQLPIIVTQNQEYSQGVALKFIEGSHLNSTFAGHYDLASFLVMTIPILIVAGIYSKKIVHKAMVFTVFILGMWLLVNSASRISFVSIIIAETFALILANKKRYIIPVATVCVLFIGLSSNLISRYSRFFDVYTSKVKDLITFNAGSVYAAEENPFKREQKSPTPTPKPVFEDRSTSIRVNVEWPRALRAFYKNPLLGTGFSSIDLATDNDYLRIIGETGLLGLYTFGLFFINLGRLFLNNFSKVKNMRVLELSIATGFIGSLPGLFLNGLFIDIYEASKFATIFWLLCGLTVGILVYGVKTVKYKYNE